MNSVPLNSVEVNSVRLNTICLNSVGVGNKPYTPKIKLHPSLVDAWFMSGYSNSDSNHDIVGIKGNVLVPRNFAWAKNSGFGKYNIDFRTYKQAQNGELFTQTDSYYRLTSTGRSPSNSFLYTTDKLNNVVPPTTYIIKGLPKGVSLVYIRADQDQVQHTVATITSDGIYNIPKVVYEKWAGFWMAGATPYQEMNLTIEQVPEYEGSLVFDGVDDYAECNTMPIQTDYTVIAKRDFFKQVATTGNTLASKSTNGDNNNGAFMFERSSTTTFSYGQGNAITRKDEGITWQTKLFYGGVRLTVRANFPDTNTLTLGSIFRTIAPSNAAIYWFALYDKSLTVEEIEIETIRIKKEWNKRLNTVKK